VTIRFFARKGLSKLPYAPIPVQLLIAPGEAVTFWWTYLPQSDHPGQPLLLYWGNDIGELRFLWRLLRPGMVFFDIGAYHGLYALVAAKRIGACGRVVAFEPSSRERRRAKLHLRVNGIRNSVLEAYALGSVKGRVSLYTAVCGATSYETTMNSLRPPPVTARTREEPVETIDRDQYLTQGGIQQVDLCKVDTEGAELEVFRGAQQLLSRFRPPIICEVLDWVTRPWGYRAHEIVTQLRRYDYEWFDFREDGTLFPHQSREDYPDVKNYLAVPREKRAIVEEWVRP